MKNFQAKKLYVAIGKGKEKENNKEGFEMWSKHRLFVTETNINIYI